MPGSGAVAGAEATGVSPRSNAGKSAQPPFSPSICVSSSFPNEATMRCRGPRAVRTVSHKCQ